MGQSAAPLWPAPPGTIRADQMAAGIAFLPGAGMVPWSHRAWLMHTGSREPIRHEHQPHGPCRHHPVHLATEGVAVMMADGGLGKYIVVLQVCKYRSKEEGDKYHHPPPSPDSSCLFFPPLFIPLVFHFSSNLYL